MKTPLYRKHIEYNAKMTNFFGWELPLEYESSLKEAKNTRVNCGLFDISHMGKLWIKGENAFNLLQKLTANDLTLTNFGKLQYNIFLNQKGGIIDDVIIYNFGSKFLCITNAVNTIKVYNWLKENQTENLEVINESLNFSLISLQGPKSSIILEKILKQKLNNCKYMHFFTTEVENKKLIVSRSGYTAEDGFELFLKNEDAIFFWELFLKEGENYGIKMCGLGARDILRIEAGYPLYGHEISEEINPFEASLNWVVKLNKEFICKDILLKMKDKINKKRIGFIMQENGMPRQNYEICIDKKPIGKVTSAAYSPNLEKFIGMGLVDITFAKYDLAVEIKIRDKYYKALIKPFNFISSKTYKNIFPDKKEEKCLF